MKNQKISLSQIGLYNPQRLNDEVIENIFVVRIGVFRQLTEKLQKEKSNSIPQHYLIIAQRGMGKTMLLKRMEVELRKKEYSDRFIPLLFPEEQYNLKNLAEFWLNSLDALADTLEFEKHPGEVQQIDTKVKELQQINNDETLAKEAFEFLKSFTLTLKRRPVLLIDNMSLIFDRMSKDEQHTLRAWLMQNGAPILMGASAVAIEDTFNYGAPFYDAFQIHYLKKLSFEELVEIITNLAKLTQEENIIPELQTRIARLKTLHQLTGGNPRTATMLFRVIIKGFSKEINDDLEALLDEITPLYKARFEELSTQMQVIVDAIALNWDPILIEQLRAETRYENNQLSPQLKRLTEAGWIEKIMTHEGKGYAYQISERFFNIWFLMRRSSRRQKRELYCLSKFLESFYGDELTNIAKSQLQSKTCSINHVTYNLALAEVVQDEILKLQLSQKSYNDLKELSLNDPEIEKQFDLVAISEQSNYQTLYTIYLKEKNIKRFQKAEELLRSLIQLTTHISKINALFFVELGNLYQEHLQRYPESEIGYLEAIKIDNKNVYAWNNLANLYKNHLKRYAESEMAYLKAIELDDKNASLWNNLGNLYKNQLQKYNDSEMAFLKAIELDEKYAYAWNNLGNLYQGPLKKYTEAEAAYLKAIEIDKTETYSWNGLGNLYQYHLHKYAESENAYLKATELDKKDYFAWSELGSLYQYELKRYAESESAYLKAIELNKKHAPPWNGLGNLYQDNLKKYDQAEKAYKSAIVLDDKMIVAKYNLVFLYRDKLNKLTEAEALFTSIKSTKEVEDSFWLNKTLFELYKHNKGIATEYFKKALAVIQDQLPIVTQDDWWRFGAVVNKLGYSKWLTEILEEKGYDIILSPYYVSIKAMSEKDTEGYLNSKAVEIREPARKIMELMKSYTN